MSICRHKKSRFWALHDTDGVLICVCVYKKGAQEVQKRLQQENKPCSCRSRRTQGRRTQE